MLTKFNLKKFKQLIFKIIVLFALFFSNEVSAISVNTGFESGFTEWTASGTGWLVNNALSNLRSGLKSIRLNTNSTAYRKISNTFLTKTVNNNVENNVTFTIYVKADDATSQIKLGIYDVNLGTEILQSGTSTASTGGFTELTYSITGIVGHTYYPLLYAANSIAGIVNIYLDDVQFFTSAFNLPDAVSPSKPTTLSATCTSNSINLGIIPGTDSESGIAGLLIIRKLGIFSDNPIILNKTNYSSVSSLIGPMFISGYKVVYNDTVVSNYIDTSITAGKYTYLVYMRDEAGNYTSLNLAARIWVFDGINLTNQITINTELDGLYLPPTCQLTIGTTSAIANVTIRIGALIHIGGSIFDYGSFNNTAEGSLTFDAGSNYRYIRNGNSLYPIVNANWEAGSNCLITGVTNSPPLGTGQLFGNFSWDCVGQNIDVDIDTAFGTSGSFTLLHTGGNTTPKTIWLNGNTKIKGDIIRVGGTLNVRANSNVYLNGSVTQNINIAMTFHKLTIDNSVGVKLKKSVFIDSTLFLNNGQLNINGFILKILNNATISRANGSLSASPAIPSNYNLIYTQPNTTSFELTSAFTKLTNLTINTSGVVTLTKHANVNGLLTFVNGIISTDIYELRIFNTSTTAITGYNINSYVDGILNRFVSGSGLYNFPVGSSSNYELVKVDLNGTVGINNIKAVFNQSNPGVIPAGLTINNSNVLDLLDYGYWTVTPNSQPISGDYCITCCMGGAFNGPTSALQYGIVKRENNSAPWQSIGQHSNSTQSVSGGTITAKRSGLSSFSDFGIGFGGESLPISVSLFELSKENQNAVLNWTTATELNNDHFDIERGFINDDMTVEFKKIGEVSGKGTSNSATNYQFTSKQNVHSGIIYFRLRQVDVNGNYTYSEIKSLFFAAPPFVISDLYPNPTDDNFNFEVETNSEKEITIKLINSAGQLMFEENRTIMEGFNSININVENLPRGIYNVELVDENNLLIQSKKIVKY